MGCGVRGDLSVAPRKIPSIIDYANEAAFGVVVGGVTYLSSIFGELAPISRPAHAERYRCVMTSAACV
jgi:hypothetical protein